MIAIVISGVLGATTGALLVPIYQRAFRVVGFGRLLWAIPVMILFWGSLVMTLSINGPTTESNTLIALWLWLAAMVAAAVFGWRRMNANLKT